MGIISKWENSPSKEKSLASLCQQGKKNKGFCLKYQMQRKYIIQLYVVYFAFTIILSVWEDIFDAVRSSDP